MTRADPTPPEDPLLADPATILAHDGFVRAIARRLLRDEANADDVAQETWLAAVRSDAGARTRGTWHGWLRVITERIAKLQRRREERRLARERRAARREALPDEAEIRAREEVRAAIVDAVFALEEPYRTTVLLRFFEDLPPRAIAARMQVPVETVRTRLKRALAMLRPKLDQARRDWRLTLLALPIWDHALARAGGLLLMSQGIFKGLLAALLLAALMLAWWFAQDAGDPASAETAPQHVAAAAAGSAEAARGPAVAGDDAPPSERTPAAAAVPATTGTLRVRVLWGDTREPAAGVPVQANAANGDRDLHHWSTRTDARGEAILEGLSPGRHEVRSCAHPSVVRTANIAAGTEVLCTLVITDPGGTLHGRVLDELGNGVPGARIWATDGHRVSYGSEAAIADADGRFTLERVATLTLAARADGFAPSPQQRVSVAPGGKARVTLTLPTNGASLEGQVIAPDGSTAAGAHVVLGAYGTWREGFLLAGGEHAMGPTPLHLRTTSDGRFAATDLAAGRVPVQVIHRNAGVWRGELELPRGSHRVVSIRLDPAAKLSITVRNPAGRAIWAFARLYDLHTFGRRSANPIEVGRLEFDGLLPGETTLTVEAEPYAAHEQRVALVAGQTTHIDVTMARKRTVTGRAVYPDGRPVALAFVSASQHPWHHPRVQTGSNGEFELSDVPVDRFASLLLRRSGEPFDCLVLRDIEVPDGELLLRVVDESPWTAGLRLRLVDPDGAPVPHAVVWPRPVDYAGFSEVCKPDPKTGEVLLDSCPAVELTLTIQGPGLGAIRGRRVQLEAGRRLDLGDVVLHPAAELELDHTHLPEETALDACIVDEQVRWVASLVPVGPGRLACRELAPGQYFVLISGTTYAAVGIPFAVSAGDRKRLAVPTDPGEPCRLRVEAPGKSSGDVAGVARMFDAAGRPVGRIVLTTGNDGYATADLQLRPGSYRARFDAIGTLGPEVAFTIRAGDRDRPPITLSR